MIQEIKIASLKISKDIKMDISEMLRGLKKTLPQGHYIQDIDKHINIF